MRSFATRFELCFGRVEIWNQQGEVENSYFFKLSFFKREKVKFLFLAWNQGGKMLMLFGFKKIRSKFIKKFFLNRNLVAEKIGRLCPNLTEQVSRRVFFVCFFVGIFDFRLSDRQFSVDDLVLFVLLGSRRYPLGDADLSADSSSLLPSLL